MSERESQPGLPDLERFVDDLSARLMTGDWQLPEYRAELTRVLDSVSSSGSGLARVASTVRDDVARAWDEDADQLRAVIVQGLIALQNAIATAADQDVQPPLAYDAELLRDFIVESRDHLATAETKLLEMESNGTDRESINAIFRAFHTIKGLAGFLELAEVREVAHVVETLLDEARAGRMELTPDHVDAVLTGADLIRRWLSFLESSPDQAPPVELRDISSCVAALTNLTTPSEEPLMESAGEPAPALVVPESNTADTVEVERAYPPQASQPAEKPAAQMTAGDEPKDSRPHAQAARSVKVDTDKLDFLVDMVGEMVIAQTLVRHDPVIAASENQQLGRNLAQLARITDEIQRTAMSMRMVPIGGMFQRMARLVRDLARRFGKSVQLRMSGEDVELDRHIVEELADPLMHMLRNAIDHGIESVEERKAAGKPETATVELAASHSSGRIVIEVADDGRGLDKDRIAHKARALGIVTDTSSMSDDDMYRLIFEAGFSTAEKVSDISGRGVGMDVVKRQLQKLRGSIDVHSQRGKGTRFSLRLPLTTAIINGLIVMVGDERYIIPLYTVREMLRPAPGAVSTIEGMAEVVLVRDQLLPMLRLSDRLGVTPRITKPEDGVLVVTEASGRPFCLMVDDVLGKQEVVIKSLGRVFQGIPGLAGGAILGDGNVGLILDIQRVFA